MKDNRLPWFRLMFVCLAAAMLGVLPAGCIGYRVGSTLPSDLRTVHVPPFENQTGEPQLEGVTTRETIRRLQQDGNLRVTAAGNADCVLNVALTRFQLEPARFEPDSPRTVKEYRLRIWAEVELRRRISGEVIASSRAMGQASFEAVLDLASGKREAMPEAANDLARDIVSAVVESW